MDPRKIRALWRHRAAMAGLSIVVLFLALSGIVGFVSPYDPDTWVPDEKSLGPSSDHWLGTDNSGRDILTRLLFGARLSLGIGVACVLFSIAVGVPMGAAAGFLGGWVDMVISRFIDVLLSFPSILLAIAIAAPLGASWKTVIISVGVVGVPQFARQVRASALELREREFVAASRALGAGRLRILMRDILPNALGPIIVLSTLGVGTSILTAAGLSFVGLGVEAGRAEWGAMLYTGFQDPEMRTTLALFSGLAISLAVLGFNLFGDGLRDALDPRTKKAA